MTFSKIMHYTSTNQFAGKIRRLSQHMLLLAKQRNWEAVSEIETERQVTITALFSHPQIQEKLSDISEILRDVIEFDRQCILLGEQEQADNSREISYLRNNKRAVFAYLDNSS